MREKSCPVNLMRISTALIVKNEEACLAQSLEAARQVADDYILALDADETMIHLDAASDLESARAWYAKSLEARPDYAPSLALTIDWIVEYDQLLPVDLYLLMNPEAFAKTMSGRAREWAARGEAEKLAKLSEALTAFQKELEKRVADEG